MSSLTCLVVSALLLVSGAETARESPADPSPVPPAAEGPVGDRVTLKSGRALRGVKVLHATSFKLVLEVLPTVTPLEIPLRQVARIEYGLHPDTAPSETALEPAPTALPGPEVLEAVQVSPELAVKLHRPVVEKSLDFQDQDIVNILRSTAILGEIDVTFGPALANPEGTSSQRLTVSLGAGQTFDTFVRQAIIPEVPGLRVEYRFQSIHFDLEQTNR